MAFGDSGFVPAGVVFLLTPAMLWARPLKNYLILAPVLAETSEKDKPICWIFLVDSAVETFLKLASAIPFGFQIDFVAEDEYGCFLPAYLFDVLDPLADIAV